MNTIDNLLATIVCLSGGTPFAYTGWTTSWSTDLDDAVFVSYPEAKRIADELQSLVHNSDKQYLVTLKTVTVEAPVDELTDDCKVVADRLAALLLSPRSQRAAGTDWNGFKAPAGTRQY